MFFDWQQAASIYLQISFHIQNDI